MIGLLLKEYYSLRTYFIRQVGFMALLYLFLCFTLKSMTFFSSMMVLLLVMLIITSFGTDESAKWNAYALTLPLDAKMLVRAKYFFCFGMVIMGSLLFSSIGALIDLFTLHNGAGEIFISTACVACMYIIICAITLPLFFGLGPERARLAMSLAFIVPFLLFVWGSSWLSAQDSLTTFLENLAWGPVFAAAAAGCLVLIALSYVISVRIVSRKEF